MKKFCFYVLTEVLIEVNDLELIVQQVYTYLPNLLNQLSIENRWIAYINPIENPQVHHPNCHKIPDSHLTKGNCL